MTDDDARRCVECGRLEDSGSDSEPQVHRYDAPRWVDLLGIDPDYLEGRDIGEWLED